MPHPDEPDISQASQAETTLEGCGCLLVLLLCFLFWAGLGFWALWH